MLVVPARPSRGRRDHAHRLVIDALDLPLLAVLPGVDAEPLGPGVSVAFALETDQDGRTGMRMGFRVAAILVLADPEIERVAGHEGLDAPPAGRAAVVERQIAVDDVGDEVRAS